MELLPAINLLAFLFVTAYAIYLFISLVKTRYEYIKLGKKTEFNHTLKERLEAVLVNVCHWVLYILISPSLKNLLY